MKHLYRSTSFETRHILQIHPFVKRIIEIILVTIQFLIDQTLLASFLFLSQSVMRSVWIMGNGEDKRRMEWVVRLTEYQ